MIRGSQRSLAQVRKRRCWCCWCWCRIIQTSHHHFRIFSSVSPSLGSIFIHFSPFFYFSSIGLSLLFAQRVWMVWTGASVPHTHAPLPPLPPSSTRVLCGCLSAPLTYKQTDDGYKYLFIFLVVVDAGITWFSPQKKIKNNLPLSIPNVFANLNDAELCR